ncbi:MAG: hypothetical protein R3300_11620 [Candidatus Promineifilaceae bacterium]|nr:hypothetical protein [Candidatus Promineifilaceae bacterium]
MSERQSGYELCLEQIESQWLAHVPPLPGCFAVGPDPDTAAARVPQAVAAYLLRMASHLADPRPASTSDRVVEMIREWTHPNTDGYLVNAFFASDAEPLAESELEGYKAALLWSYDEVLAAVADVPRDLLWQPVEGDWSLGSILNHTSQAEWWYLNQFDLAPGTAKPESWRPRLELTQRHLLVQLPELVDVPTITVKSGELWSARKMLRRALYHRQDHTGHLHQIRDELGLATLA